MKLWSLLTKKVTPRRKSRLHFYEYQKFVQKKRQEHDFKKLLRFGQMPVTFL